VVFVQFIRTGESCEKNSQHMYQLVSIVSFENDELAVIAVVDLIQDRVKQGFILTAKAAPRYCVSLPTQRMLM